MALFYLALARAPGGRGLVWFFLVPVIGVLMRLAPARRARTPQLLVGWRGLAGLWLVLGPAARGRLVDSPRRRERPCPARRP